MRSIYVVAAAGLAGCLGVPPDAPPLSRGDAGDAASGPDASAAGVDLIPGGTPSTTDALGGTGGGGYTAFCPDDRFVTGLAASANGFGIASVQAICSRFQLAPSGEVALVDSVDGDAIVGDPDATALAPISCSAGLVVVSFEGSENGNEVVSHLQLACAPMNWDGVAVVRDATELTDEIGSPDDYATGGGACPTGMAAGGISGRYGILIDAFRLECFEVVARAAE
jgi:hypothetical protein